MKNFDNILNALKERSPLPSLYQLGYTPDRIKHEIIQELGPFFENPASLEEYAINFLVSDWVNLLRLKAEHPSIESDMGALIWMYRNALSINKKKTTEIMSSLMPKHVAAGNRFWGFISLEIDKSALRFEDYVQESMQNMSDIIEGIAKTLFIEQVAIHRINRKKDFDIRDLFKLKLGNIIDELIDNSPQAKLFKTHPDNLRFSDWRNISAHFDYIFKNDRVFCEYGATDKRQTISLSRQELSEKVKQIARTMEALNLAHKFFAYDNLALISQALPRGDSDAREEISFLMFASAITSQGYEIIDIDHTKDEEAIVTVRDLTKENPVRRGIHSSQFTYGLWVEFEKKRSTVKYQTIEKNLFLKASADAEVCEKIAAGVKSFEYLAEKIELIKYENNG